MYETEAAAKSANIDITLFYSNGSYGYYFVSPSDASIEAIFQSTGCNNNLGTS